MAYKIVNKPTVSDIIEHAAKDTNIDETEGIDKVLATLNEKQQTAVNILIGMILELAGMSPEDITSKK